MNHDLILILKSMRIHSRTSRRLCNIFLQSKYAHEACINIVCQNCLLTASVVPEVYGNIIAWIKIS